MDTPKACCVRVEVTPGTRRGERSVAMFFTDAQGQWSLAALYQPTGRSQYQVVLEEVATAVDAYVAAAYDSVVGQTNEAPLFEGD